MRANNWKKYPLSSAVSGKNASELAVLICSFSANLANSTNNTPAINIPAAAKAFSRTRPLSSHSPKALYRFSPQRGRIAGYRRPL